MKAHRFLAAGANHRPDPLQVIQILYETLWQYLSNNASPPTSPGGPPPPPSPPGGSGGDDDDPSNLRVELTPNTLRINEGQPIPLSDREYAYLYILCRDCRQRGALLLSKQLLMKRIEKEFSHQWPSVSKPALDRVKYLICNKLRRADSDTRIIELKRNVGVRIAVAPENITIIESDPDRDRDA